MFIGTSYVMKVVEGQKEIKTVYKANYTIYFKPNCPIYFSEMRSTEHETLVEHTCLVSFIH